MLPRDLNGVVDPQLRVYGMKNIRVMDLSVLPLHTAVHPQGDFPWTHFTMIMSSRCAFAAVIYGLAEKGVLAVPGLSPRSKASDIAADIIKQGSLSQGS